jgi:PAS domain S-box-containing protein
VQAEEQLREREAQYRSIFEATTEGLSIVDMDGFFVEVNPAFCAMFGYRHDELIGLHATAVMHPDEYHLLAEAFPIIAAGGSVQVGGRGLRKDGTPFPTRVNRMPWAWCVTSAGRCRSRPNCGRKKSNIAASSKRPAMA